MIAAYFWEDYINKKSHEKPINITVYILGGLSVLAGIAAIFSQYLLPKEIYSDISEAKLICIICALVFGTASVIFAKLKKYFGVFIVYVLLMATVSAFITDKLFKIDYKFGQQDLMEFAKYAQEKDYTISTFGMDRKYSLIYYNDKIANFHPKSKINIKQLKSDLKKKNNVVIMKNNDVKKIKNRVKYKVIKKGRKYSLLREVE